MVAKWKRILRHLATPDWVARRHFTSSVLDAIEAAIVDSETRHRGEIRFAIESEIELTALLQNVTPRERAVEAFGHLGVWDTEENSGVLLFVQLVDRRVEIVVDRGIARVTEEGVWRDICDEVEQAYAAGDYEGGSIIAVTRLGAILEAHFPAFPRNPNELPDRPMLI
ncbi:MAG: TPM domain-containing protein [Rhodocyclaceae bacterium]|nr:TPM domain-containing protein [Rhodocyclaceae bacterium]